jgi:hypothetical protein
LAIVGLAALFLLVALVGVALTRGTEEALS